MRTGLRRGLCAAFLLMFVLTVYCFPVHTSAASTSGKSGDCTWTLDSDGTLTVSGNGAMSDYIRVTNTDAKRIVIENGVTKIGDYSFSGCTNVESVLIPDSVTSIGFYAFSNCSSLTSITVPMSVKSIKRGMLEGCSSIEKVTVAADNTVYDSRNDSNAIIETKTDTLIIGCSKTIIPDTVTSIGESAFNGCTGLKSIIIPDSVTTINQKAFSDCTGASVLRLSDTVTSIDYSAFRNCSGITEIVIPKSVSNINNNAFVGCTGVARISVSSENETYDSRDNCNAVITTKTDTLMLGCKSTAIPASVKIIGFYAFKDCRGLTELVLPDNIEEIKNEAFAGCTGLTSASISKSVTTIGKAPFSGCNNLTSITVSEENTVYDSRGNCNAIVETETNTLIVGCSNSLIPNSVTAIGDSAFSGFTALERIALSDSITVIGDSAFSGCTNITTVTIPDSVKEIGKYAFRDCTGLSVLTLSNSVTKIDECAFYGCTSLRSLTIPESVKSIGTAAFANCDNLYFIYFPDSAISIGSGAFSGTAWYNRQRDGAVYIGKVLYEYIGYGDTNLIIKDGTLAISDFAFSHAMYLKSITIPDSVECIGSGAFLGCTNLTEIRIPGSVDCIDSRTFEGCTSLSKVTIPDSVTAIGDNAFDGCTALKSISIPDSVTSIGRYAFSDTSLQSVTIPDSVTDINNYAFFSCKQLTNVRLPSSITRIPDNAFYCCSKLTSIDIPESVTSIGQLAFENCTSLYSIKIPDSVTEIGGYAFDNTAWYSNKSNGLVYAGKVAYKYKGTCYSLYFNNDTLGIANNAFENCKNLYSVTIPDTVKRIGFHTFGGCSNLSSITIPVSVVDIEQSAFSECPSITNVYYSGCEHQWNKITIGNNNTDLTKATIHYTVPYSFITDTGYPATCTKEGLTEGSHCSVCGEVITAQEVIPTVDHKWDNGTVTKEPGYKTEGEKTYTCTVCGEKKTESIPASTENVVEIKGQLTADYVADDPNVYYVLGDNLIIPESVTFTLKNGAQLFGENNELSVYGTFIAENAALSSVKILAKNKNYNPCNISIEGCSVTGGELLPPTGNESYCNLRIKNNTLSNIERYIYIWYPSSDVYIEGNVFRNCGCISVGSDNNVYIRYNSFYDIADNYNSSTYKNKVLIDWAQYDSSNCYFEYNNVYNDNEYAGIVGLEPGYDNASMIAANNYWGTTDTAKIQTYILDIKTDYSCAAEVEYLPIAENELDFSDCKHKEVIDKGYPATCTEDGLSDGSHCSICGKILTEQTVIPKTGHKAVIDEAVKATCQHDGLTVGSHCEYCGLVYVEQTVIPKLEHTPEEDEAVPPGCTENGLTAGSHCCVCGEVLTAQEVIPALDHSYVAVVGVKANHFRPGLSDGIKCSRCGDWLIEQHIIPQLEGTPLLGDANDDGEVDTVDATIIQRTATHLKVPYTDEQLIFADVDGDGEVTIVDATYIQRYATHVKIPFPIGE